MEALLFSPNGKPLLKQKVTRENETSYFPVIDKKGKRIGIFKTNIKSVRNIPMIFKY
jgi:gamma-glutamyltranspeptidase